MYHLDAGGQNEQQRTALLGPDHCVGARLSVQLPTTITSSGALNATVEVPSGNGQLAPAPNVLVELTPHCATLSPLSGRTDANGAISASVTPTSGCTSVSIDVVARAAPGARPLASGRASAHVPQPRVFQGRYEIIAFTLLDLPNPPRDIPQVDSIGATPGVPNKFQLILPIGCGPPDDYELTTTPTGSGLTFTGTLISCGQITVPQPHPAHVRGEWNSSTGELHIIQFHDVLPDGGTQDDTDSVLLPCSTPAKPGFIECSSVF
jgi:hypothetical protein